MLFDPKVATLPVSMHRDCKIGLDYSRSFGDSLFLSNLRSSTQVVLGDMYRSLMALPLFVSEKLGVNGLMVSNALSEALSTPRIMVNN